MRLGTDQIASRIDVKVTMHHSYNYMPCHARQRVQHRTCKQM